MLTTLTAALLGGLGIPASTQAAIETVPAFPGAQGFGATTPGGRGGRVIEVTNLRNAGPGSLRAALESAGRRIVVFRVSGTIVLNDDIDIEDPYVTVLGQTAPGGGITLKNSYRRNTSGLMDIKTHDVVIRFLRFRAGRHRGQSETNPLAIDEPGAHHIVIDHNSFSWGVDENLTTYDYAHDITLSWNVISEGLRRAGHPEGSHSRGLFMSGEGNTRRMSVHHNLLAHNDRRNPEINLTGVADVVNNVVYNWGEYAGMVSDKNGGLPLNFVGNHYKPGPNSRGDHELEIYHRDDRCFDSLRIYARGNIGPNRPNHSLPERRVVEPDDCVRFRSTRFAAPQVSTTSAAQAYADVLAGAGALVPHRDAVDRRIVREVRDGTGRIIDRPSQVGGWPSLPAGEAPADTDHDGMPDAWEVVRGLQRLVDDSAGDRDGDGYTNIEEYANSRVAGIPGVNDGARRPRVRLDSINFRPEGTSKRLRLTREVVRLENRGTKAIDIANWVVRDQHGNRYRFTKKVLTPGGVVTLHTGVGRDSGRHRFWGRSRPVWNDRGDRATLINRRGAVIDRCAYARGGRSTSC